MPTEKNGPFDLALALADTIANERFRRLVGPDNRALALEVAGNVIAALGLREMEASKVYDARFDMEPEHRVYMESALRAAIADAVVREAIDAVTVQKVDRARGEPYMNQMTVRTWVVTRRPV